eukprot:530132_1
MSQLICIVIPYDLTIAPRLTQPVPLQASCDYPVTGTDPVVPIPSMRNAFQTFSIYPNHNLNTIHQPTPQTANQATISEPSPQLEYKLTNGSYQCLIRDKESGTICNRLLAHKSSLQRHKRTVHDKFKPFECTFMGCSSRFARRSTLTAHVRIHTGERPYRCPYKSCCKAFKQKPHLQEHIRIHTGEKPFCCSLCGARFRHRRLLRTHRKTHTEHAQTRPVD